MCGALCDLHTTPFHPPPPLETPQPTPICSNKNSQLAPTVPENFFGSLGKGSEN